MFSDTDGYVRLEFKNGHLIATAQVSADLEMPNDMPMALLDLALDCMKAVFDNHVSNKEKFLRDLCEKLRSGSSEISFVGNVVGEA